MNALQAMRARNAQIAKLENEQERLMREALAHPFTTRALDEVERARRIGFEIASLKRMNQKELARFID